MKNMRIPLQPLMLTALCLAPLAATAQQTPPVAPRIQETPLPPAVELPAPDEALPADVPSRPLTADEAALVALRRQPGVAAAQASVAAAQGRSRQALSGLRPSVSVSGSGTDAASLLSLGSGGGNSSSPTTGFQGTATLRQLLFDWNHTRDLASQTAAQEQAATENVTRVQSDLVLQVKQAFYTYVQNMRLIAVNESNLRNRQEHLAQAKARLRVGVGLPLDVVRAQTAVASAIFGLNVARNNASIARVNLAALMGIDPRTPIQAAESDEPAVAVADVNALVATALKQRPEVRQAAAGLDATQFGLSAAKSSNAPAIAGTAGFYTRSLSLPTRSNYGTFGVVLQWTPFDSGLTAGRVREAQANATVAEAQAESVRLGVVSDVSQAYLNLRTAEQRVVTAESEITNAQESVRLAEGRYRGEVGTFLEVTDAQAALLAARTNRVNAQSAVDQARAALARAIGGPLPVAAPAAPAVAPAAAPAAPAGQ